MELTVSAIFAIMQFGVSNLTFWKFFRVARRTRPRTRTWTRGSRADATQDHINNNERNERTKINEGLSIFDEPFLNHHYWS
eukprot:scaffold13670_cov55-Cyclotella_meneghiniana.AAC.6